MNRLTFVRPLVRALIESPATQWQYQGFGMLRIYPEDGDGIWSVRLNIWMPSFAVPGVSVIHDHPWDFTSLVVGGSIINTRYMETEVQGEHMLAADLKPGPGGGQTGLAYLTRLGVAKVETLKTGNSYRQRAKEIHKTTALEGTVTINERERKGSDVVRVFWPMGEDWVSAEPRPATEGEVIAARAAAMKWLVRP